MEPAEAAEWYARWEAQQDGIVDRRAERFAVMLDVVEAVVDTTRDIVVLDLASGPAGISARVLERFPTACCVALDLDPVLLAIGRGTHGDGGGRLQWVEHDLRDPSWRDAVRDAAGRDHVDAVLTSTALHWIPAGALIDTYRGCAELLVEGGVLVNADNMDPPESRPVLRRLADDAAAAVTDAATVGATDRGYEGWDAWWDAVAASHALADLHRERTERYAWRDRAEHRPGLAVHVAALEEAGFREVDTVWQRFRNRVLVAIR